MRNWPEEIRIAADQIRWWILDRAMNEQVKLNQWDMQTLEDLYATLSSNPDHWKHSGGKWEIWPPVKYFNNIEEYRCDCRGCPLVYDDEQEMKRHTMLIFDKIQINYKWGGSKTRILEPFIDACHHITEGFTNKKIKPSAFRKFSIFSEAEGISKFEVKTLTNSW
jgi:hypothetical protein